MESSWYFFETSTVGRAYDLFSDIPNEIISSTEGTTAVVATVHIRDHPSAPKPVFIGFHYFLLIHLNSTKIYHNYEGLFAAQVAKYYYHHSTEQFPQSILAMRLLSGSNFNDTQRIPILSGAGSELTVELTDTGNAIVTQITYENIASIFRQCDTINIGIMLNNETYVENTANATNRNYRNCQKSGRAPTTAVIRTKNLVRHDTVDLR